MSTDVLDRPARLGTSGYGVFAGEDDDEDTDAESSAGGDGPRGSGTTRSGPNSGLRKRGSQRSSFFGRLGTKRTEAEPEAALSKMQTGKAPLYLKQLRVQLSYEEDAFPAGLELDMFALLYDKEAKYLDCIFYRNTEDAAGAFSLNANKDECLLYKGGRVNLACFILQGQPYNSQHEVFLKKKSGLSASEIEMGRISITGGFMGPTLKQIALGSLEAPSDGSGSSGLIYLVVGEADGEWFYKNPVVFSRASLDALMVPSKELAQEMTTEMQHPEAFGLPTLDSLIKDAAMNRVRRLSHSSDDSRLEAFSTNSVLRQSIDRANSLRQRIADIKSSLRSREDIETGSEGKISAYALMSKRVDNCERRQTELEVSLHQIQSKVDYLYAYLGVDELHTSQPPSG